MLGEALRGFDVCVRWLVMFDYYKNFWIFQDICRRVFSLPMGWMVLRGRFRYFRFRVSLDCGFVEF